MMRLGWITVFGTALLVLSACAGVTLGSATPAPAPRPASAAIAVYATADDAPLRDVLVYLHAVDAPAAAPSPEPAALDLMHRAFEPRVLAVPVGSEVTVHNLDDVDHDLYSFSTALPFSLRLAAQGGSSTLRFARPGVVVLGCKVHNEMVGYVYVSDTPYFGKTDANGYLCLAGLPPGRYTLGLWRPDAPGNDEPHLKPLVLAAGAEEAVRLRL